MRPEFIEESGKWLRALGSEFGFSHEDLYRIELCFAELVTNVVSYSDPQYAGQPMGLHASLEAKRAVLTLFDPAAPFDPFSVAPPPKVDSIEDFRIGGQGVPLIREFSNAHRYERRDGKNKVELVFELEKPISQPQAAKVIRNVDRRHSAKSFGEEKRAGKDRRALGFLSWSQIFHGIPYSALETLVERLTIQTVADELLLLKPGDENDVVLVVLQGSLKIYLDRPGSGECISIDAGGFVGEMSVIDHQPVSAYVVAEAGTRLLVIDSDTFVNEIMLVPGVSKNLLSAFSERMRSSNKVVIQRMRKELEMEFVQRELQYAKSIQEGLLPKEPLFPQEDRLDCCGRMVTAREVGGDFYDIFFLDSQHVFFVIGDVCGKGLPAALFMVRAMAALRAQTGHDGTPADYAAQLITRLNRQLCSYNDALQFLTAFCGILDLGSSTLYYVNAGHNPPAIASGKGEFSLLSEPVNPFIGMIEGLGYRAGQIEFEPGSVLLLYTDGVTEAENNSGGMLGEDRLLSCLNGVRARRSGMLVETVFSAVHDFAEGAAQSDDITVLAISLKE